MKISDCCGALNRGNGDTDYAEFGICPDCKEHCEFIEEEDDEDNNPPPFTDGHNPFGKGGIYTSGDPGL